MLEERCIWPRVLISEDVEEVMLGIDGAGHLDILVQKPSDTLSVAEVSELLYLGRQWSSTSP